MLGPALIGFVTAHLIDSVAAALAFAAAAFAWEQWFLQPIGGPPPGTYWAVWPFGVALAGVTRVLFGRTRLALVGDTRTTPPQLIGAGILVLAFSWYTVSIEDPGSALVAPFASGALLTWLLATLVLIVLEIAAYYTGAPGTNEFHWRGASASAWYGITALIVLDLLVWRHGWLLVLLAGGAFIAMLGIGGCVRAVGGAQPRSIFEYS
jgi:hypothetical protein